MVKNTPEDLEEIVAKLANDLFKNDDCRPWHCDECPIHLKEPEEDLLIGTHNCGWILLLSTARKILAK